MAVYEPEDFDKLKDPQNQELARKADKLRRIRAKQKRDNELKELDGTPTSIELEQQFYGNPSTEEE
jgi:hypothetical protein